MGTRRPSSSLANLGRPPTGAELSAFFKWIDDKPILDGIELEITLDGSTNRQQFAHGLGRAYRGVIVVGDGTGSASVLLKCLSAGRARLAGVDVRKDISVVPTAATNATYMLWVY